MEVRTLRYFQESPPQTTFKLSNFKDRNVLVGESSGDFTFHFQDFKTSKFVGHDEVTIEVSPWKTDWLTVKMTWVTFDGCPDIEFWT